MPDARKIIALLGKAYPEPRLALNYSSPLELLVAVILSRACASR